MNKWFTGFLLIGALGAAGCEIGLDGERPASDLGADESFAAFLAEQGPEPDVPFAAPAYIPYHGAYRLTVQPAGLPPYAFVNEVAGGANFTLIGEWEARDPALLARFKALGIHFVVQFDGSVAQLNNTNNAWIMALQDIKLRIAQAGANDHLVGLALGEELYACLNLDCRGTNRDFNDPVQYPTIAPHAGQRIAQGNALRDLLEQRYAEIDTVFPPVSYPDLHTTNVDYFWNDDASLPAAYYMPPPRNLDVLGLDPYFTGDVRACDAGTRAQWDASTGLLVRYAMARFPHQALLLVGQSFRHAPPASNGWQTMPAPCQLEWWYQLAATSGGRIPALLWFAYGHDPAVSIVVGVRAPGHESELAKLAEISGRNLALRP